MSARFSFDWRSNSDARRPFDRRARDAHRVRASRSTRPGNPPPPARRHQGPGTSQRVAGCTTSSTTRPRSSRRPAPTRTSSRSTSAFVLDDGRPGPAARALHRLLDDSLAVDQPRLAADATAIGIKIAGALETVAPRRGHPLRRPRPATCCSPSWASPVLAGFDESVRVDAGKHYPPLHITTPHTAPEVLEGEAPDPGQRRLRPGLHALRAHRRPRRLPRLRRRVARRGHRAGAQQPGAPDRRRPTSRSSCPTCSPGP